MAASEDTGSSGVAERYALALLDLADEKKALDPVADDLRGIKQMLEESADLQRLIRSPLFSREQQSTALAAVLEKAGVSAMTRRFVLVVARNRRLFELPKMIATYLAELARRRGEMTAHVTSARALTEQQQAALAETLRAKLGAKVQVDTEVDPSLIAGLVVRVGSRMIDSSLRTKLEKLQFAMKGVG